MGKREEKLRVTGLTGHWHRGECTIKNKMRKDEEKWIYCALKLGKRMNDASREDSHVLIPTTCKCVFRHRERGLHIRAGITKWGNYSGLYR